MSGGYDPDARVGEILELRPADEAAIRPGELAALVRQVMESLPGAVDDAAGWWKGKSRRQNAEARLTLSKVLAQTEAIDRERERLLMEREQHRDAAARADAQLALDREKAAHAHEEQMYAHETARLVAYAEAVKKLAEAAQALKAAGVEISPEVVMRQVASLPQPRA